MSAIHSIIRIIIYGTLLLSAGCQSVYTRQEPFFRVDEELKLSAADTDMASALANFSVGVLREGMSDNRALTNYMQAAEFDPAIILPYLKIVNHYIINEQYESAVAFMEKYCERNPRSTQAQLYLAQLYTSLDRLDKAEKACLRAIDIAPHASPAYLILSAVYSAKKDHVKALKTLQQALVKVDDTLAVLRHLGDIYAQQAYADPSEQTSEYLEKAINYYNEAAQKPFDELTPIYLHRLGDLLITNRDFEEAIRIFEKLSLYKPDDVQMKKKLALCFMAVNDQDNAVRFLKKAMKLEPDNAETYYYLAELYKSAGNTEKAIKHYKLACNAGIKYQDPYIKLAEMYFDQDLEKASGTLLKGLEHMPENVEMLTLLARIYLDQHKNVKAKNTLKILRQIVETKKNSLVDSRLLQDMGKVAAQINLLEKAAFFYQEGLQIDPSSLDLYVRLAFLHFDQSKEQQAIKIMKEAVSVLPNDPNAHYYLGLLYHRSKRYPEAITSYEKTKNLALHIDWISLDSSFYFHYGAAFERMDDFKNAEEMLTRSITLNTSNAKAFNYLAYMWAELNINLRLALEYVTHALDINPHNGAYIDTLGWVYYRMGEYQLALDHIANALYFMPDDPVIAEHKGDILNVMNRKDEALEWWIYSFRLDSSNKEVKSKLLKHGVDIKKP